MRNANHFCFCVMRQIVVFNYSLSDCYISYQDFSLTIYRADVEIKDEIRNGTEM